MARSRLIALLVVALLLSPALAGKIAVPVDSTAWQTFAMEKLTLSKVGKSKTEERPFLAFGPSVPFDLGEGEFSFETSDRAWTLGGFFLQYKRKLQLVPLDQYTSSYLEQVIAERLEGVTDVHSVQVLKQKGKAKAGWDGLEVQFKLKVKFSAEVDAVVKGKAVTTTLEGKYQVKALGMD